MYLMQIYVHELIVYVKFFQYYEAFCSVKGGLREFCQAYRMTAKCKVRPLGKTPFGEGVNKGILVI